MNNSKENKHRLTRVHIHPGNKCVFLPQTLRSLTFPDPNPTKSDA